MDDFTETTTTSLGGNIGSSFTAIFFGLLLLIGSIGVLWWNESRSVNQMDALNEMQSNVISLADTRYHPEHEGKPLLLQGEIKPLAKIHDPIFDISFNGLAVKRKVEMYQWKEQSSTETKKKMGGSTEKTITYNYEKDWSTQAIKSSSFKQSVNHSNPPMNHKSKLFTAEAKIGDYMLTQSVLSEISISETYEGLSKYPATIGDAKNHKSFLYIGDDANNPAIGDIKISYRIAPAGRYTVVAKLENKTLIHYTTKNAKQFAFVKNGAVSADKVFSAEQDSNSTLTWILRGVGLLMMFIGFAAMIGIITTFASIIPGFGALVNGVAGVVASVLTLILGSIIIALAWFSARPMLSVIIIVIGIAVALLLSKFGKKKKANTAAETASSQTNVVTPPPRKKTQSTPPPRTQTPS